MEHIQAALTPEGVLDNALSMFDRLSAQQKDEFIQKYEGKEEDFQDA
jgi:hypothetical protein